MVAKVSYTTFLAFRPHFDALARVGYFKIVLKEISPIKRFIHDVYRMIVWIIVAIYNLQHLIRVIQYRHSTDQVVNTLFILLTTMNTCAKQLCFNIRSRRVDRVISIIDGPIFAPTQLYHEKVMKENAVVMRRLLWFYIGCIFVCGSLWMIFPVIKRALGEDVEFTGYFPFDTTVTPAFEIAVAYMNIFITLQAYGNVTMDCTIVAFYAQAKVQLQILRYNLEHLVYFGDRRIIFSHGGYKDEDKYFKRDLQSSFVKCIWHHQKIKWIVKEVESIFAEALVFQFLVTAWVICMTAYKIVNQTLLLAEFLSMAMYLGCVLAQLVIYCYYGTQVKYESEFVNQSIFYSGWQMLSPSFRRQLLIIMENASRPIVPRTSYIIPISLETYLAILRASYTLFTFLDRKRS